MGLLRNSLIYLGFVDDDLEGEIGAYQDSSGEPHSNIRKIETEQAPMVRPIRRVRQIDQVHVVEPESYSDSAEIGDKLRNCVPVIVNLKSTEDEVCRRIMAFSSGLVYALDGKLQKLMPKVYLVTPPQIEVSTEDRRRLAALSI